MAKIFYTDLNLNGNQLLNAVVHNVTSFSDSTLASPKVGQICYLTVVITYDSETCQPGLYQYKQITESTYKWVLVGNNLVDLTATDTDVVTGSRHINNSTSKLQTVAFGSMKPGQATSHLYDGDNSDENTTLARSLQGFDDTVGKIRYDYLQRATKEGGYEDEILLNGTDGHAAKLSGVKIETSEHQPMSNDDITIPTTAAVQKFVGSISGGLNYKGILDSTLGTETDDKKKALPTSGVKVGDIWVVAHEGHYTGSESDTQAVGDMIIASSVTTATPSVITWTVVPVEFAVVNNAKTLHFGEGLQQIATIDGHEITVGIQQVTSGYGNVDKTDVGVNGNILNALKVENGHITAQRGFALQTISHNGYTTEYNSLQGVITGIAVDDTNKNIVVTHTNYTVANPGLQYVRGIQQASNGKIEPWGKDFDTSVYTSKDVNDNAPTTKAVYDFGLQSIQELDATVETNNTNVNITITEVDGKLTSVTTTQDYADITRNAKSGEHGTDGHVGPDYVVKSGDGDKLVVASDLANLKLYADDKVADEIKQLDVAGYKQAEYDTAGNITIGGIKEVNGIISRDSSDSLQTVIPVNHEYTTSSTATDIATVKTVTDAIQTLDVDEYAQAEITNSSAGSTVGGSISIKGIKEVNGKIDEGDSVTLTADAGLRIYDDKIGHTNSITAETNGKGSVGTGTTSSAPVTKVLTGVKYDAQGHFTAASETELTDVNIPVNGDITNLDAKDVHSALAELQGDINSLTSGTRFMGTFDDATDITGLTTAKVGDQYIYVGETSPITVFGHSVEKNDMIIISAITTEDEEKKTGTPANCVVIERSLDRAVQNVTENSGALVENHIVLGANGDNVKNSNYVLSNTAISGTTPAANCSETNILTEKATITSIDNRINELNVNGYRQGNINTNDDGKTSTIKLFGIKEVNGKIEHDSDKDSPISVDGVYSTGSTSHNYLATESTVKNAIDALDNDGEIISSLDNGVVTLYKTITETDGIIGISGDVITFAKVATTGKAEDVSIADTGNYFTATNVEAALAELASGANAVKMWSVTSPAITAGTAWTINITTTESDWTALTNATVSVRASNGEEVECDKVLTGTTVKLTFSENFTDGAFTAVVTTKGGLVTAVANA